MEKKRPVVITIFAVIDAILGILLLYNAIDFKSDLRGFISYFVDGLLFLLIAFLLIKLNRIVYWLLYSMIVANLMMLGMYGFPMIIVLGLQSTFFAFPKYKEYFIKGAIKEKAKETNRKLIGIVIQLLGFIIAIVGIKLSNVLVLAVGAVIILIGSIAFRKIK